MAAGPVRRSVKVLTAWVALTAFAGPPAQANDATATGPEIERLNNELSAAKARLTALEAEVARLSALGQSTRDTLANELAQPMLLLVGDGQCPTGFARIKVEAMLLMGPRTAKNSDLLDAAGLADDEQQGVGARVYRYLDLCYRAPGAVTVK